MQALRMSRAKQRAGRVTHSCTHSCQDPEIGEDLEEFESWTPLHSEKRSLAQKTRDMHVRMKALEVVACT